MGTKVFRGIAVFLLILLLVPTVKDNGASSKDQRTGKIIAINTGVRPFTFRDDKGEPAGFASISTGSSAKMGLKLNSWTWTGQACCRPSWQAGWT